MNEHPELFAHGIDIQALMEEADRMPDSEYEKLATEVFNRGGKKTAAEIVRESRGGS